MITRGARIQWVDGKGNPTGYLGTVLYVYTIYNAPSPRSDSPDMRNVRYMVRWDDGFFGAMERENLPGDRYGIILHDNPYPDPEPYWQYTTAFDALSQALHDKAQDLRFS